MFFLREWFLVGVALFDTVLIEFARLSASISVGLLRFGTGEIRQIFFDAVSSSITGLSMMDFYMNSLRGVQ